MTQETEVIVAVCRQELDKLLESAYHLCESYFVQNGQQRRPLHKPTDEKYDHVMNDSIAKDRIYQCNECIEKIQQLKEAATPMARIIVHTNKSNNRCYNTIESIIYTACNIRHMGLFTNTDMAEREEICNAILGEFDHAIGRLRDELKNVKEIHHAIVCHAMGIKRPGYYGRKYEPES